MSFLQTRMVRAALAATAAGFVLAGCGSSASDVTSTVEPAASDATTVPSAPVGSSSVLPSDEAIANAEANIGSLQLTDDALDTEVLAVGDGSVTTVRDVVDGDRAVLLWFYAPH